MDKQALIDGIDFAIDWGLPISPEDYIQYESILREGADEQKKTAQQGFKDGDGNNGSLSGAGGNGAGQ